MSLTCTISQPTSGAGYGGTSTQMRAYRSGSYHRDGLDDMYNRGGTGTKNTMVTGLGNQTPRNVIRFTVSCSAQLSGPGLPAGGLSLPVSGLVVADAESSNPATLNNTTEYLEVEAPSTTEYHLLDRHRTANCTASTNAEITTSAGIKKLRLTPIQSPCASGPTPVLLAEGTSEVTITARGQGSGAAAIGAVLSLDYGDAPVSYGLAAGHYSPTLAGTGLSDGNTDLFNTPLATLDRPNLMLGSVIDAEPVYPASGQGTADDTAGTNGAVDDEDAIAGTPSYRIQPGVGTTTQQVSCQGAGYVRGWLDWDRSNTFEADEASDKVACSGNQATLSWQVPSDAQPGASYLRLRIAASQTELDYATGISSTGEVEDYPVNLTTFQLAVSKSSDALAGQKRAGDLVTYTISLTNTGTAAFTAAEPARLFDDATGVFDDASLSGSTTYTVAGRSRGTATWQSGRLSWRGTLNPGETLTLRYRVRLKLGGDRLLPNVAWGQLQANAAATPKCVDVNAGADSETGLPCARTEFGLLTVLKGFEGTVDPNPDPGAWTLTATGNFGGEATDVSRSIPGASAATLTNTVVVPIGELFTFSESASGTLQSAYEFVNPQVTGKAGQSVTLLNRAKPASIRWRKTDATTGQLLAGSVWTLSGPGGPVTVPDCVKSPCQGPDADSAAGAFLVTELGWGTYTLREQSAPQGYQVSGVEKQATIDSSTPQLVQNLGEIPNSRQPGTLSWSKAAAGTLEPLGGSQWRLAPASGTPIDGIEDCITDCSGMLDQDPRAGGFTVTGLEWGTWTLTETRAPVGYVLTTRQETVVVGANNLNPAITAAFLNQQVPVPVLPLTGGTAADLYLIAGSASLLLAGALVLIRSLRARNIKLEGNE